MTLNSFFMTAKPNWKSSLVWDSEDRNLPRIEARAEKLADLADASGNFDELAITDIIDEAYEYIVRDDRTGTRHAF